MPHIFSFAHKFMNRARDHNKSEKRSLEVWKMSTVRVDKTPHLTHMWAIQITQMEGRIQGAVFYLLGTREKMALSFRKDSSKQETF